MSKLSPDPTFERMSSKDLKSTDQIRRHSIDVKLENKAIEKSIHIFTQGDEVQKLSVVAALPEILQEDRGAALQGLVPKMLQGLSGSSTEYHVTMSASVQIILKDKSLSVQQFVDTFLQTIVQHIDHKDQAVAGAWCDTLLEAIQVLPLEVLRQHVAPLALQRSQVIRPSPVRTSSCLIFGELATRYDINLLKKDLLPAIAVLCQDSDVEVRVTMALQLVNVIKTLKTETFRTTIGNSLLELASDEAVRVKEAAFTTISNVLEVVGLESVKTQMLPVIRHLIHFGFKNNDSLLVAISENFGKMCLGVDRALTDKEVFVKYYITIAGMGALPSRRKATVFPEPAFHIVHTSLNPDKYVLCRQAAASNFPSMCKFVEGNTMLTELLQGTLNELSTDSYYVIRRIVGQGIAETCNNLGKMSHLLKNNVTALLLDEAEEVLDGFIPNLSAVIECLIRSGVYKVEPPPKDTAVADLNKAILRCENIIWPSHNWRLYSLFMSQIECIYKFNPTDTLFNSYISLFLKRMHGTRVVPVRISLMRTVLVFLRYLQKSSQRSEVRNRIINEFCQSPNFYNRVFYIRSCYLIFDLFSTHYFKEYFFFRTLQLMDDPVPNVRWALLIMLPKLKQMTKPPSEKKLQALVDTAISKFADDKDKEISKQLEAVKANLDVADPKLFQNDAKKLEEELKLMGASDQGKNTTVGAGNSSVLQPGGVPGALRRHPMQDSTRPSPLPGTPRSSTSKTPTSAPSSPRPSTSGRQIP